MPSPNTALATLRPDLGDSFMEFDFEANRRGFIGQRVFPTLDVKKPAGTYGIVSIENLLKERSTRRTPGAGYSRQKWEFDDVTFACKEHGAEEVIDRREAEMYADYFDAEQVSAARALDAVLRNQEARIAALLYNGTTFASNTTAITNEWDDATNAVPITDIETGRQGIYAACGMQPNTLILNRKQFVAAGSTANVLDRLKYSGHHDPRPGAISEAALAQALGVDQVFVADAAYDSALQGQAASMAPIWSDEYMFLCKVATSSDFKEPCIGRIFHYAGDGSSPAGTFETYAEENIRSDVVRVRHDVDEVLLYVEAGWLYSNAIT